jgi:Immunoglobulin domain
MRNKVPLSRRLQRAAICVLLLGLLLPRICFAIPPPVITVQPLSLSVQILGKVSFSVVASSGTTMSYQWYKNASAISGATLSSFTIVNVQTSDQGTYAAKVTNAGGSVTSSDATLTVLVPPAITTQPQSQVVAKNSDASFNVMASGTAPLGYQWCFGGTPLAAATSSALTVLKVQNKDLGSYTVVVTNVAGSLTSAVADLSIFSPVVVVTQPQSQTVTQGQNASFAVVASGTTPLNYQWSLNNTALSGAASSKLALTNVQTTDGGNYRVMVWNPWSAVTSVVATLTVYVPPAVTTQPQSQAVLVGHSATFSVAASGTAPLGYQWSLNGTALPGATSSALALTSVQTTDAGGYTVVVTNVAGSNTSAVAALMVYIPPAITTQPLSQAVTCGQTASFSVLATGTAPLGYQWSLNGTALPGATSSALTLASLQATDTGNYTVVVTNTVGSITSAVAALTVNVSPAITMPPQAQTVMVGQSASFSVTASGTAPLGYQWSFNGTALSGATSSTLTLNNAQTTDAGSYAVVVANVASSVTSGVATLTVTNPLPPAPPSLGAAGITPNGFTFQLSVPAGSTYVILATTNLQDWTPVFTNVALSGSVVVTDPGATTYNKRFYRALVW